MPLLDLFFPHPQIVQRRSEHTATPKHVALCLRVSTISTIKTETNVYVIDIMDVHHMFLILFYATLIDTPYSFRG